MNVTSHVRQKQPQHSTWFTSENIQNQKPSKYDSLTSNEVPDADKIHKLSATIVSDTKSETKLRR